MTIESSHRRGSPEGFDDYELSEAEIEHARQYLKMERDDPPVLRTVRARNVIGTMLVTVSVPDPMRLELLHEVINTQLND